MRKVIIVFFLFLSSTNSLFSQTKDSADLHDTIDIKPPTQKQPDEIQPTTSSLTDWANRFQIASAIVSILAFPFAIYQLWHLKQSYNSSNEQLNLIQKSNKAEIVIGLFNEFREPEFDEMRNLIAKNGKNTNFKDVVQYSHMLNHFGFLLEHGYVDIQSLYDMMGRSVIVAWDALSDQIRAQRILNDNPIEYRPYQYHFQFLNYELRKYFVQGRKHINELVDEMEAFEDTYKSKT